MSGSVYGALRPEEFAEWNDYARQNPLGNIFCNTDWAATLAVWDNEFEVFAGRRDGTFCGGVVINSRRLPVVGWRLANVEGGVLLDPEDAEEFARFYDALMGHLRRTGCVELRLLIRNPIRVGDSTFENRRRIDEFLAARGIHNTVPVNGTYWIDLKQDDDALLAQMSKNCRRDVRKAEREGVTVEDSNSAEALDTLYDQFAATYGRKGLRIPKRDVFVATIEPLLRKDLMRIYYARFDGRIVNMALVARFGSARYTRGASIAAEFERPIPPTGQILHFEIMRRLRAEGYRLYDLGGSPGPEPQEGHPNYGVWRFKHGFGGSFAQDLGDYSIVLNRVGRRLMQSARRLHDRFSGRHVRLPAE